MLAGQPVAKVSDSPTGCTPSNQAHDISHGNANSNNYTFWDTPGLNENEEGTRPSQVALGNLLNLIGDNGINLLIYCIRGRLVDIVRINYDLFWGIICRKAVPIVLVVTGLEQYEDMDDWWRNNGKFFDKMNMSFQGHACITTTKGRNGMYMQAYEESAKRAWKLVEEHCRAEPWRMEPNWSVQAEKKTKEYMENYNSGLLTGMWKVLGFVRTAFSSKRIRRKSSTVCRQLFQTA